MKLKSSFRKSLSRLLWSFSSFSLLSCMSLDDCVFLIQHSAYQAQAGWFTGRINWSSFATEMRTPTSWDGELIESLVMANSQRAHGSKSCRRKPSQVPFAIRNSSRAVSKDHHDPVDPLLVSLWTQARVIRESLPPRLFDGRQSMNEYNFDFFPY